MLKNFVRNCLCRRASRKPFYTMKPKPQALEGSFLKKINKFEKRSKNRKLDFFGGHNFLRTKKMGAAANLTQGSLPQPVLSIEPKISDIGG